MHRDVEVVSACSLQRAECRLKREGGSACRWQTRVEGVLQQVEGVLQRRLISEEGRLLHDEGRLLPRTPSQGTRR